MRDTVTLVCGDFGKPHEGHLLHILKASQLGDELIIAIHPDGIKERKGYEPDPLWFRMATIAGWLNTFGINGYIVLVKDTDELCVKTLEWYHPQIYAKGGDRVPETMPQEELDTCERLGIRIIYGVGEQISESRRR